MTESLKIKIYIETWSANCIKKKKKEKGVQMLMKVLFMKFCEINTIIFSSELLISAV